MHHRLLQMPPVVNAQHGRRCTFLQSDCETNAFSDVSSSNGFLLQRDLGSPQNAASLPAAFWQPRRQNEHLLLSAGEEGKVESGTRSALSGVRLLIFTFTCTHTHARTHAPSPAHGETRSLCELTLSLFQRRETQLETEFFAEL